MTSSVDTVVKIGGGLLARPGDLTTVLATVSAAARHRRILVVPGGGPFADTVRHVDRRLGAGEDAAHWMAVLAMDQFAHLIAARIAAAALSENLTEIDAALDGGRLPVLAPYRWMRAADPLPHSWDVTSDSIAAWVAGTVGAGRLVLVKPAASAARVADVTSSDLVDGFFDTALPNEVTAVIVGADQLDRLEASLGPSESGPLRAPLKSQDSNLKAQGSGL
jgi:aspartokinase-like uncharacterized kinase